MILTRLTSSIPDSATAAALEQFEREFSYPLGKAGRFRISHGQDYSAFFRAMGEASLLMARKEGRVLGMLATVMRKLWMRAGSGGPVSREAHLLCDLKVIPESRGSTVLASLIRAAKQRIEASRSHACYCVVMEGTAKSPLDYTGRLGIPKFGKLAEIMVLRVPVRYPAIRREAGQVSLSEAREVRDRLSPRGILFDGSEHRLRSRMEPVPLKTPDNMACGIVEDTLSAKRLFEESGREMLSAHVSGFAFATPSDGAALLNQAQMVAAAVGFSAIFAAVPRRLAAPLVAALSGQGLGEAVPAPAEVYGYDFPAGLDWWLDTAEI